MKNAIKSRARDTYGHGQARLTAALVRIAGMPQVGYVLDWFYNRSPTESMTTSQEMFINELVAGAGWIGRQALAQLILDPRFDTIPEPALRRLVYQINTWFTTPVVSAPYDYVYDLLRGTSMRSCFSA